MIARPVMAAPPAALFCALGCGLLCAACTSDPLFSVIGTNMANPLTVAVNSATNRAYVLNANDTVLYTTGSVHVVNLATVTTPARVSHVALDGFGGQLFLDAVNNVVYVTNRVSEDEDDAVDVLQRINVNEASGTFLSVNAVDANGNPFGIGFDRSVAPVTQLVVPSREGFLDVFDISAGTPTRTAQVDLKRALSNGNALSPVDAVEAVVIGAQAFVTRATGGLLVVNLSEATSSSNPVDYFVEDLEGPRGIATDGAQLYVVDASTDNDGNITYFLRVLNLAPLTADGGNTTTAVKDKDTDSLLVRSMAVGGNAQEVVIDGNNAYVTNLDDDTVTVMNIPAGTVTTTISVGDEPFGMAFYQQVAGTNTHLLVCNHKANTVSIIALASNSVVATYP